MDKNNKTLKIVSGVFLLCVVFLAVYFNFYVKNSGISPVKAPATTTSQIVKDIVYKNTKYGFAFTLPLSWKGYTIVNDEWDGYSIDTDIAQQVTTQTGPLIFIRHPAWTEEVQRQDIPIMVFTLDQWSGLEKDEFHIGAAPIGPNEIGRNSRYVFAIPARYNFSYLVGFEEVEQIIQSKKILNFLVRDAKT